MLVLAALRYRRQQATDSGRLSVPVPVLFPLHGWDPGTQRLRDWLVERLQQTYLLFSGPSGVREAERLVDAGKLAVILDDLDQMTEEARPVALQALSRQARFRLIILTRRDEMVAAASGGPLAGAAAVELQPVDAVSAADYLARVQLDPAPTGWSVLVRHLRSNPGGPVAQALSSPLNLTLVRDTYRDEEEIKDFLRFCNAPAGQYSREDISDHLLDQVLPAAYASRPGDPPPCYDLKTANDALRCLAGLMKEYELPELPWWWIRTWAPAAPRIIATGAAFGVCVGIAAGLASGIPFGVTLGLTAALMFGLLFGSVDRSPSPTPPRMLRHVIRPKTVIRALPMGLAGAIPIGLPAGLAVGFKAGLPAGLAAGLAFGLAGGFAFELQAVLWQSGAENAGSPTPRRSWRSNRLTGLTVGLTGGVAGGLAFGIAFGLAGGLATGLAGGLGAALAVWRTVAALTNKPAVAIPAGVIAGSGIGLAVGFTTGPPAGLAAGLTAGLIGGPLLGLAAGLMETRTWSATLAFVQLGVRKPIPVRLMHFLEDARERNVLRTVGPVYQFRHARLLDHLAAPEPSSHAE